MLTKFQNFNRISEFQPNCNVSSVISGLNISVKKWHPPHMTSLHWYSNPGVVGIASSWVTTEAPAMQSCITGRARWAFVKECKTALESQFFTSKISYHCYKLQVTMLQRHFSAQSHVVTSVTIHPRSDCCSARSNNIDIRWSMITLWRCHRLLENH